MPQVFIAGVGMTAFGRLLDRSIHDLVREAVTAALSDAGAEVRDIEQAFYATATHGPLQGQTTIAGPIAMRRLGVEGVPVFTVENACASGSSAFHLAVQALRAGACDIALAVGCEKMNIADKARMLAVFEGGWDVSTVEENKRRLLELGAGVEPPPGTTSDKPYSVFMDVYAAISRRHMRRHGTTPRQIAAVTAKNRAHAAHNPLAQFRNPLTIEEVLAAPPITYPLTLPMCAPISDGAAATLLVTPEGLKRLPGGAGRAVEVLASVVTVGVDRDVDDDANRIARRAALQLYEMAGVSPSEVDVAEVHDATAMGEILNAEALLLAPDGAGGPEAERGAFSLGGRIPINPSGGLEAKGHPIAATGLGQIHELVMQLRGEAGPRQVGGARLAIQENGGGLIGVEEAVVAVTLLARR